VKIASRIVSYRYRYTIWDRLVWVQGTVQYSMGAQIRMILWKIQLGSNPDECKCEFNCDYRGRCTYVWQRTRLCQLWTLVSVVFSHLLRSIAIIFKSEPNFFSQNFSLLLLKAPCMLSVTQLVTSLTSLILLSKLLYSTMAN